jgi:hypothetical protein
MTAHVELNLAYVTESFIELRFSATQARIFAKSPLSPTLAFSLLGQ